MESLSRATEKELDHHAIHMLSCDHAGSGRGTDDGLQHNESDQLQDMADHCAGWSLERPGVSTTLRNPADICEYFNDVSSGALWAAKHRHLETQRLPNPFPDRMSHSERSALDAADSQT